MDLRLSHADMIDVLDGLVKQERTERKAAKRLGISQAYLNDIRRGIRRPGPKVLRALGFRAEIIYLKKGA